MGINHGMFSSYGTYAYDDDTDEAWANDVTDTLDDKASKSYTTNQAILSNLVFTTDKFPQMVSDPSVANDAVRKSWADTQHNDKVSKSTDVSQTIASALIIGGSNGYDFQSTRLVGAMVIIAGGSSSLNIANDQHNTDRPITGAVSYQYVVKNGTAGINYAILFTTSGTISLYYSINGTNYAIVPGETESGSNLNGTFNDTVIRVADLDETVRYKIVTSGAITGAVVLSVASLPSYNRGYTIIPNDQAVPT